ncbi:MAG: FeoA family protein [Candidatus Marinimicrobia bacterium]|jgi:Fe2+ transport system protein FeoA|nr:FeoA family protein [Candidatus Neomarinimicrobiota bacterium]
MSIKQLHELLPGESAQIISFHKDLTLQSRLVEMGILPGVEIRLLKKGPFNGPIEIKVRSYEVAIRYKDAMKINVS